MISKKPVDSKPAQSASRQRGASVSKSKQAKNFAAPSVGGLFSDMFGDGGSGGGLFGDDDGKLNI